MTKSKTYMASEEEHTHLARLRDEWETARQCIDIRSRADDNLKKQNISTIDNYATGDAIQFMVSTSGKVIHVQQLSRDMTSINFRNTRNESSSSPGNTPPISDDSGEKEPTPEFSERHGRGFRLTPKSSLGIPTSSIGLTEGRPSNSPMT
ncbi:hypothetical protein ACJ73_05541 [Blastomyces percursus]|uniref:Uncharacterized protein n=1 Tax=Blastomyces percursus TaxID=1658174 RepID=A0A1J9R646_9EURO|nr:hypothetical protein ACJ73_05541 [Blastomyces percursus]